MMTPADDVGLRCDLRSDPMRVLVSGGGIGGLAAATALTQRGIDVDLIERATSWRTNGAGITLNPNGERALRALGLDAAVADAGQRGGTMRGMDAAGSGLGGVSGESWAGGGGGPALHPEGRARGGAA